MDIHRDTAPHASTSSLLSPSQTPFTVPLILPTLSLLLPLILNPSQFQMLRVVRRLFRPTITHSSLEERYVRLEILCGKDLKVPSERMPAGIYISINVDSRRRWKSAISVLSSEESAAWVDTVTLSPQASPAFSVEIRASYEADRMLGSGELIGKLQLSWHMEMSHSLVDLSFPSVRGVHPSLTLKVAVVHACDDALSDTLVDCKIARDTDASHARLAKYVTRKRVSHLKAAVQHFQLVLAQCPVSHPDHAAALTNLACARLKGYVRNDLQDIDGTTSLFREALALRPQRHPDHPLSLYNLTEALPLRRNKKSTAADAREAAQLYHELLPLCPEGTYLRSIAAGPNGVDYVIGGCNNLPIDASDEGICLRRVVLELCPQGHQLPVSLCPEGHSNRDYYLNNLAFSLKLRFDHQGKPNDLDEAISLYEEAPRLRPGAPSSPVSTNCKDIDDITRAISLHREALTLRPLGQPHRGTTLSNLAHALKTRYNKLHVSEDLNEAIDLYRESLRLTQLDHPERHVPLFNLSSVLCSRFTHTQKNEDVEEAIQLCRESLAVLSSLHPSRYYSYFRLQEAYMSRYCVQYKPADLALAVENFRLASRHPTQGFPARLVNAYNWTVTAERFSHASALEAYVTFFELLDGHLATRSSTISRREAAAAFHYARLLPSRAGQQWSLASRLKTPVEDLESANPKLAHNYLELSKLVSNAAQDSTTITDRAAADRAATEYRKLAEQWEAAVAEIRSLQAFSRFLLPPSYANLQAAARHGPVIILIASQYSCSAIIVPTSGDPHHVPLSSITLADLKTLKDRFTRAIRHASRMDPAESRTDLIVLWRTVWDEIMLPIVNVLENVVKLKRRSRIWLCPTAAFTSIPLHAANPFQTKADRSKEPCLEDLYICSYTPTLSALIRSRRMMKKRVSPSFVAIGQGQPGAGKGKALSAVDSELDLVHKLVPATATHTIISGDAATRAGALQALEENTWVHLACHGKEDPVQPYNSHFVMRDEHLTLLDIIDKDIPRAEFAFLSACHTAVGDEETPDEVIHLAVGLQFSGFKSVVGTLWEVDDAVAKHIVKAFYKYMFNPKEGGVMDPTKAAWALNCAKLCYTRREDKSAA
ncbi:CHAT domain-containing protein [Suillus placidus]|uniref:CHAT domain-containing protein n=1 Tax=Suillus placidus TaxID=48579 RepID=A0A9P6ZYE5_9AGAM|nr:CHAT domain-containing protein [Suillus placidus]